MSERVRNTRRHRLHDEIVDLVRAGGTNAGIAAQLGCCKRAVARVRDIIGLPAPARSTTRSQKLAARSFPDGDHVGWSGLRGPTGTPRIRVFDTSLPASHVAFQDRAKREPVGIVKAVCDYPHCLNGAHLSDEIERRRVRTQERALYGLDEHWDVCTKGLHDWDTWGRISPDLSLYCAACNTERAARSRSARIEEGNTS